MLISVSQLYFIINCIKTHIMFIYFELAKTLSTLQGNSSHGSNLHFVAVLPIIRHTSLVMIGNGGVGEYVFPNTAINPSETAYLAARRAAFIKCGCLGDLTMYPFHVDGPTSWYVMNITREDGGWDETYATRKHIELIDVATDPTISDHLKEIINEANLQGFIVY